MGPFAERLRRLRTENGLTLEELSDILNKRYHTSFNKGILSKYENGKAQCGISNAIPIAQFFNVSVDYLIGNTNDEHGTKEDSNSDYYINQEARELAQFMHDDPEYRVLFKAIPSVSKKDIEVVKQIIDKFKKDE